MRIANDQLSLLEKGFLFDPAFPGRPGIRYFFIFVLEWGGII